jgi:hypothetical protein
MLTLPPQGERRTIYSPREKTNHLGEIPLSQHGSARALIGPTGS